MRKVRPFPAAPRLPRHNLRPRRRSSKTLLLCHRISIGVNWKLPGLENCCGSDKQKLAGGVRSRPPRPGPFGPLYAESLPPAAFRALRALLLCAKGLRPLDSTGRTNLKTTTNNLRLKLERRKESFRAEETRRQSGENEFTHFLRPDAGFRCAPCSTACQQSWLPGSGGLRLCFSLRLQLLRRQTQPFLVLFRASKENAPVRSPRQISVFL